MPCHLLRHINRYFKAIINKTLTMDYTDQFLFGGLSFGRGLKCLEQVINDTDSGDNTGCFRDYDPITETCWPPTLNNRTVELLCESSSCLYSTESRTCLGGSWHIGVKDISLSPFDKFIIACIILSVAFLVTILCVFTSRTIRDSCSWCGNGLSKPI